MTYIQTFSTDFKMLRSGKQNTGTLYSWQMPGVAHQITFPKLESQQVSLQRSTFGQTHRQRVEDLFFSQNVQSPIKTNEIRRQRKTNPQNIRKCFRDQY